MSVQPGTHVLVVEDEVDMRDTLRWALEDEGIAVQVALDGLAAVASAAQCEPAVVVLDMGLPGLDGIGVARELRARYGSGLPILVVTAAGGAAEKARQIGAFAYLHKPFDLNAFVACVRRGLDSRGAVGVVA